MKTTGNKILITGATDGIGYALATAFTKLDNQVIAVGRNAVKLQQLAVDNMRIIPFRCDVSRLEELEQLAVFVEQQHRDLNVLINNAGIQYNYLFADELHLLNKIEYELNVNLLAPIRLTALLLPILKQNTNAALVNVSSGLGLVPKRSAPVYCGTKAGIHIFTKALRYQLQKINVFEIIPPLVDTSMTRGRGRSKITPEQLAHEFIQAFAQNTFEVNIGKVKLLRFINRFAPGLADRILKNS